MIYKKFIIIYRSTGSSIGNLAKGSAGLWLRRSPIEFPLSYVEKIAKLDAQPRKEIRQTVVVVKEKILLIWNKRMNQKR